MILKTASAIPVVLLMALNAFAQLAAAQTLPPPAAKAAGLVPEDKQLSPAWVQSLTARGEPEWYSGDQLRYIGMPIGGIGAGMLYLGGDGKLWDWEIFNVQRSRNSNGGMGQNYAHPAAPHSPISQGFALRAGGKTRTLDAKGFSNIRFRGEYPVARVEYKDAACPVAVSLEAFSPFVPLKLESSAFPATTLRYTVTNTGNETVEVDIGGWLENAAGHTAKLPAHDLRNAAEKTDGGWVLDLSAAKGQDSMALELVGAQEADSACALLAQSDKTSPFLADLGTLASHPQTGAVTRKMRLAPGESGEALFVLAWRFPDLNLVPNDPNLGLHAQDQGRLYAKRFDSAKAVAAHVAAGYPLLSAETRAWRDTWYDSTLPWWFLDRTFCNTSTLATETFFLLGSGRPYSWEGVGSARGTCGHVWHYAHAPARLFPEIERGIHEKVDFNFAQQADGGILFRGGPLKDGKPAVDSQAGYILRALREHQMSKDSAWLKSLWPKIKLAQQYLIKKDGNGDGLIESNQHNTLDAEWYGPVAWLSGLYVASLEASETMAHEVGDAAFEKECAALADAGRKSLGSLYNGEYYINKVDPKHLNAVNSGTGCLIDQVMGQSWAWQVGLPRVFPQKETLSALHALWKYNFVPDAGAYRKTHKPGRWYAMNGEAGLLMCSFPDPAWDYKKAAGKGPSWAGGYLNECMNGFEYQAAGHMIREGMVQEGLAITRAIHDRYAPAKRNPYNEIECGDHYIRSMASYGVFLAACGFEYDGPRGHIGFAPRLTPENFKAAFTAAEGWGSFSQTISGGKMTAELAPRHGSVALWSFSLELPEGAKATGPKATLAGKNADGTLTQDGRKITMTFATPIRVLDGQTLSITVDLRKGSS